MRNIKNPHDFMDLTEEETRDYVDAIQAKRILDAKLHRFLVRQTLIHNHYEKAHTKTANINAKCITHNY